MKKVLFAVLLVMSTMFVVSTHGAITTTDTDQCVALSKHQSIYSEWACYNGTLVHQELEFNRCMASVSSTHCPAEAAPGSKYCTAHASWENPGDGFVPISFQQWLI